MWLHVIPSINILLQIFIKTVFFHFETKFHLHCSPNLIFNWKISLTVSIKQSFANIISLLKDNSGRERRLCLSLNLDFLLTSYLQDTICMILFLVKYSTTVNCHFLKQNSWFQLIQTNILGFWMLLMSYKKFRPLIIHTERVKIMETPQQL